MFYGLKDVTEVIYQAPIASLGSTTFSYSSVTRVTVPKTVSGFNNGTFQRTTNLDTVIFEDLENVPSSAWDTWINCGMFSSVSNNFWRIENFIFGYSGIVPDNVLNIPEGVVGISSYMARNATNAADVKAIVLPSTITKICSYAISGCKNIDSVVCMATVPPTMDNRAFRYTDNSSLTDADRRLAATLYVPWSADHSVKAAYMANGEWSKFASIVELPEPTPTTFEQVSYEMPNVRKVTINGAVFIICGENVYNIQGVKCELPVK